MVSGTEKLRLNPPKGAPKSARGIARVSLDRLNWDNLRIFLVAAESGSMRSASETLCISLHTVRHRITQLEQQVGSVLTKRGSDGLKLTPEGKEVLAIALRMRELDTLSDHIERSRRPRVEGQIKLTVTEGLGTFWLVPRLVEFQEKNPEILLDLRCDMAPGDVAFRDSDISVQLTPPESPNLIVSRIGALHLMPFASEPYLRRCGTPKSFDEWPNHKIVWQAFDGRPEDQFLPLFVGAPAVDKLIAIRTNTSSAHYWAVARGAGIGILPTYARAITRRVRPIDMGLYLRRDIYIVYHPDALRAVGVKKMIAWLRQSFDHRRFPWFGDTFVHPSEFERRLNSSNVVSLFEGFQAGNINDLSSA